MDKLLIVDGSALLFQSFYGMPKKIQNAEGRYVEAVVCFVGILLKTIKIIKPDRLLVVFDGENELERQGIDENYKANRVDYSEADEKDNPFAQLKAIKEVLSFLGIEWVETTSCEADDLIASVVNDYKKSLEIIISSPDKDFYQLIDDNVSVFTYRGKISKLWSKQEIYAKYGFNAKYFNSFKALMGDKSDNIEGVKGIGIVSATNLIKEYGDVFAILDNLENIQPKIAEKLKNNKEQIVKNYKMIELVSKKGLYKLPSCCYNMPEKSSTGILKQLNIL